jgi:hypothetical protein
MDGYTGCAAGLIRNPRCVEYTGQRVLQTPAVQIMGFDLETAECTDGGLSVRLQTLHEPDPRLSDGVGPPWRNLGPTG